jgi:hypothetical protein
MSGVKTFVWRANDSAQRITSHTEAGLDLLEERQAKRGNQKVGSIRSFVVPSLAARQAISWERVIEEARKLGARQFAFSEKRRFRETGMSKSKAKEATSCAMDADWARAANAVAAGIEW